MLVSLSKIFNWLNLSISSDIQKKGNYSPLILDGAYFSPNGLILHISAAYLSN